MIGFEKVKESMRLSAAKDSLNHSHLLLGPDGIGKTPLAKMMAKLIIDPLNVRNRENYIDIMDVRPQGASIGVDEVRKVIAEANIKPFEGDRKVIIIHHGDLLTVQSQNALLKTIEEPPMGVYFIILSENGDMILPTIRSRCSIHRLSPLSREETEKYIDDNYGLKGHEKEYAAAISRGIPGEADRYIKDKEYREFLDFSVDFARELATVKSIKDRRCLTILNKNKKILEYGPVEFLENLLAVMRDVALLKSCKDYKNLIFLYNSKGIAEIAEKLSMKRVSEIIEECDRGIKLLAKGKNINKETVMDNVLFHLSEEN